jgi:hypothetical protein
LSPKAGLKHQQGKGRTESPELTKNAPDKNLRNSLLFKAKKIVAIAAMIARVMYK